MIKAIETIYDGYRFRSRLEARWALFLNELGWSWSYEKEGFELEDGTWYLPDFYIPSLNTWLEVKPDVIIEEDIRKCVLLSRGFPDACVIIANGLPSDRQYPGYCNGELISGVTLTTYIRVKGWQVPYFGGDWWKDDIIAMDKAKKARFEHGENKS